MGLSNRVTLEVTSRNELRLQGGPSQVDLRLEVLRPSVGFSLVVKRLQWLGAHLGAGRGQTGLVPPPGIIPAALGLTPLCPGAPSPCSRWSLFL